MEDLPCFPQNLCTAVQSQFPAIGRLDSVQLKPKRGADSFLALYAVLAAVHIENHFYNCKSETCPDCARLCALSTL